MPKSLLCWLSLWLVLVLWLWLTGGTGLNRNSLRSHTHGDRNWIYVWTRAKDSVKNWKKRKGFNNFIYSNAIRGLDTLASGSKSASMGLVLLEKAVGVEKMKTRSENYYTLLILPLYSIARSHGINSMLLPDIFYYVSAPLRLRSDVPHAFAKEYPRSCHSSPFTVLPPEILTQLTSGIAMAGGFLLAPIVMTSQSKDGSTREQLQNHCGLSKHMQGVMSNVSMSSDTSDMDGSVGLTNWEQTQKHIVPGLLNIYS
ncbi:hypothetical protein BU15DRAFT_65756 [Melanogaster broomeanus]|nr:hypothetical protein BU15DRAFT_65756 [Melanogaster broomeanus]